MEPGPATGKALGRLVLLCLLPSGDIFYSTVSRSKGEDSVADGKPARCPHNPASGHGGLYLRSSYVTRPMAALRVVKRFPHAHEWFWYFQGAKDIEGEEIASCCRGDSSRCFSNGVCTLRSPRPNSAQSNSSTSSVLPLPGVPTSSTSSLLLIVFFKSCRWS